MNLYPSNVLKNVVLTVITLLISAATTLAFQGSGRIVGKVVDEKGEAIIGATIKIVGQTGGASTNIDGAFNISLAAGTYSLDISYISYQTKRITGVVVKAGESTPLNISLSPSTSQLNEVVIVSTYSKSNTEGLFVKQKNAINFTNGISAEQITKTPDANVGQSLKRISGISTFDNKYVVVRGISERYNVATLDGTPMPSTDYSRRNFSFELFPSEMIEGVLVHKTVTPDLPVGFGGGMIQVNTKDIPVQNFFNLSLGTSYNNQSTGQEFLSTRRGKYDFLGFDDGSRDMSKLPLFSTSGNASPSSGAAFSQADFQQSKSFNNNWKVYKYMATPNQNIALSFGRSIDLKNLDNKFGYIVSLNYRNSQNIADIDNRRDAFELSHLDLEKFGNSPVSAGKVYSFNSTLGAMLNLGFKSKKNTFSSKNSYNRIFNNTTTNVYGYDAASSESFVGPQYPFALQRFSTEPDFLTLLNNKFVGEHQLGSYKLSWDVSRTSIDRERKDMLRRELFNDFQLFGSYFSDYVRGEGFTVFPISRQNFNVSEVDYNWSLSLSKPLIKSGPFAGTLKFGYIGFSKKQDNRFLTAYLRPADATTNQGLIFDLSEYHTPDNFGPGKLVYEVDPLGNNSYQGKSNFNAGYAMIDQRLLDVLRVVGGLRIESFKLDMVDDAITSLNSKFGENSALRIVKSDFEKEPKLNFLPSLNLTYKLNEDINIRAGYSQSIVRPEFNEASFATVFNAELQADVAGGLVTSTTINSYDFRTEWYVGVGEVISAGLFYKDLLKPLELIRLDDRNYNLFYYLNAQSAKSYGFEFELRKKLGFISPDTDFFNRFIISTNFSLLRSSVIGRRPASPALDGEEYYKPVGPPVNGVQDIVLNYVPFSQNRPLYGQTPFLFNAGLEYTTDNFSVNVVHNYTAPKFFILYTAPSANEYEGQFSQTDLQLSTNFLKNKLKVKLNIGNIFNNTSFFYNNRNSYDPNQSSPTLKPGYTDNYDSDDLITFKRRTGVNVGISMSYKF